MDYDFECYEEDGGCGSQFEISCKMDEIVGLKPNCPSCQKNDAVSRLYGGIVISTPHTLGSLMDKNSSSMSEDHKAFLNKKHNEYRNKPFTGKLGDGMKTFERGSDGQRKSN
jgi:hypothetical protein